MFTLIDDIKKEIETIENSRIEETKAQTKMFLSFVYTLSFRNIITAEQRKEILQELEKVLNEKIKNLKASYFTF